MGSRNSALSIDIELDFQEIFLEWTHQTDDQLNDKTAIVFLEHFTSD